MLSSRTLSSCARGGSTGLVGAKPCGNKQLRVRCKAASKGSGPRQVICAARLSGEWYTPANQRSPSVAVSASFAYTAGDLVSEHVEGYCGFWGQLSPKQQVQQGSQLQDLPRLPHGLECIHQAFLEGNIASAPAGEVEQAGYKWVHACLVVKAWRKALDVEQQYAAEQAVWDTYCQQAGKSHSSKQQAKVHLSSDMAQRVSGLVKRGNTLPLSDAFTEAAYEAASHAPQPSKAHVCLAEAGLFKAKQHLRAAADSFAWQLMKVLNDNNCQAGLALEKVPVPLQRFVFGMLKQYGCADAWGLPLYRRLPATAAAIRPSVIAAVDLQQYLAMLQQCPAICMDEMDGSWTGDAQVRVHQYQVITVKELSKALSTNMLQRLFNTDSGFAADLAAAAAKVGVIDGPTAAAAASRSSSRSLAELLLVKFTRALVGVSAAAVLGMCKVQSQQAGSGPEPAAGAEVSSSSNSPSVCSACGGCGGNRRRGSMTAIGADDDDESAARGGRVPVGKEGKGEQGMVGTAVVMAVVEAGSINRSQGRWGVLRCVGAVVKCIFKLG